MSIQTSSRAWWARICVYAGKSCLSDGEWRQVGYQSEIFQEHLELTRDHRPFLYDLSPPYMPDARPTASQTYCPGYRRRSSHFRSSYPPFRLEIPDTTSDIT